MPNIESPRILIATGKLCAGKTTLMRSLVAEHGFTVLSAITTREPRNSDFEGEYVHLTDKEFDDLDPSDMMWNRRHGSPSRYTMLRSVAVAALNDSVNHYTRPLSPHSADEVVGEFGIDSVKAIYLTSPSTDELEDRLLQREQSIDVFAERIKGESAWDEFARGCPNIHMAEGITPAEITEEALALMALTH